MEIKDIHLWKPVSFSENWEGCSNSRLDVLLPSWLRKRETLKEDSTEYAVFMDRLKRQHAIETGIVEKLYDLSEGVTETFIKEGFVESYLQHGDTNIPPGQLMAYLKDNFEALDFAFDVVKNNRPVSTGFIKELHQLITRHQDKAEGRDQFGHHLQIPLLKGTFKERENNPTRADGTRFIYCPPIHVGAEMDKLVVIYAKLEAKKIKPVVIAAWLHHAFVAIHPFQDGNGRVARLLASLVLVKHGLFPMTVKRKEKKRYIDALELADKDEPQALVDYFGEMQRKNIEAALNLKLEIELAASSLSDMSDFLSKKLEAEKSRRDLAQAEVEKISQNRAIIVSGIANIIEKIVRNLNMKFNGNGRFSFPATLMSQTDYVNEKIAEYAHRHGYVFNSSLSGESMFLAINIMQVKSFRLLISLHHLGYDNLTIAIGALFFSQKANSTEYEIVPDYHFLEPFVISLESSENILRNSFDDIESWLQNAITLALASIASKMQ